MLSDERINQNIQSIRYIQEMKIPGDVVEIGVWKGGSMMSMILEYETFNETERSFHLYDTFTGMTSPSVFDVDLSGTSADRILHVPGVKAECPYTEVASNLFKHVRYPRTKINFHVGDIRKNTVYPESIAVLRLDTDFYDSTSHELTTFYPKVSPGGIITIDDYGHWKGCRKAVDEFLALHPSIKIYPIDYTGIYFMKPS